MRSAEVITQAVTILFILKVYCIDKVQIIMNQKHKVAVSNRAFQQHTLQGTSLTSLLIHFNWSLSDVHDMRRYAGHQ